MSLSGHNMAQTQGADKVPPHDIGHLMAVIEKTCGNKEELKRLCQDPEFKKTLPADIIEKMDGKAVDLSEAVYDVTAEVIKSGDLRPLIKALREFKSDAMDPLGKGDLRQFLNEQRSAQPAATVRR